jgi:taurine dioxygenase
MTVLPNSRYRRLEAKPIAGALGAEIEGVDLARAIDDETMTEIRAALLDHLVIFFRDQRLTPEQQLGFARRWGEIHLHPYMQGMDHYPEILEIKKTPDDKKNFGGAWHSDQMFTAKPAMATILYAREVPSAGGDTMFTNQYLAYETLSDGLKHTLRSLRAVSRGDHCKGHGGQSRRDYYADKLAMKVRDPGDVQTISAHPLVRTHPETRRLSLYIGGHVFCIEGWTEAESEPMIDFLMQHSTRPEFTCRFRWQTGSLAIWDNRCTQHFAIDDYPAETRVMHRITICGDTPF